MPHQARAPVDTAVASDGAAAENVPADGSVKRIAVAVEAISGGTRVEVFNDGGWVERAISDLATAVNATVASYAYDNANLQAALLDRLGGSTPFACRVVVDKGQLVSGSCARMRSSLRVLARAGAHVRVAGGRGRRNVGCMHLKAFVLGTTVAYVGSANFTNQAASHNWEQVLRLEGAPVADVLSGVVRCWESGVAAELNG